MKYKGYEISKQYNPGSDFTVLNDGSTRSRVPKFEDIDYYYAEHIESGFAAANCATLEEMKDHIRDLEMIDESA